MMCVCVCQIKASLKVAPIMTTGSLREEFTRRSRASVSQLKMKTDISSSHDHNMSRESQFQLNFRFFFI